MSESSSQVNGKIAVELDAKELGALINYHNDEAADAYVKGQVRKLDREKTRAAELFSLLSNHLPGK